MEVEKSVNLPEVSTVLVSSPENHRFSQLLIENLTSVI